MITSQEWDTLCLLIEEGWPGEFTDAAAKAWRVFLDDYDAGQVLAAIKSLVAKGGTFRPSVAEVAAEIRKEPQRPSGDEVVELIFGNGGVIHARCHPRPFDPSEQEDADRDAIMARAAEVDDRLGLRQPLVQAFIQRQGIARLRGVAYELRSGQWAGAERKRIVDAWDAFVADSEDREVKVLASGSGDGSLSRLDPLTALGSPTPQIEQESAA